MKLSIIIPMYNCEQYIADCLDSILKSDLPKGDYEVIIVNDGSKDKGPEIAQDYVSKHENFRYLTQENQGQSVARNYGLKEAKGEYVWFVDSDDRFNRTIIDVYHELKLHPELDILAFSMIVVTEQNVFIRTECNQSNVLHNLIISGRDAIVSGYAPSSVCVLFVRRHMMVKNNLFFKEGITHQDVELSYRLLAYANKVMFTDYSPYVYILHSNSTSQSLEPQKKIKYLKGDIAVHKSFMQLSERFAKDTLLKDVIANRAQNVLFCLVYSLWINRKTWKPLGINKAIIDEMKKVGLYPLKGPFDTWKKKLMTMFLNIEFVFS